MSTFLANRKKTLCLCEEEEEEEVYSSSSSSSSTAAQQSRSSAHIYDPVMKWIYGASVGSVRKVTLVCRLKSLNAFPYLDLSETLGLPL